MINILLQRYIFLLKKQKITSLFCRDLIIPEQAANIMTELLGD